MDRSTACGDETRKTRPSGVRVVGTQIEVSSAAFAVGEPAIPLDQNLPSSVKSFGRRFEAIRSATVRVSAAVLDDVAAEVALPEALVALVAAWPADVLAAPA